MILTDNLLNLTSANSNWLYTNTKKMVKVDWKWVIRYLKATRLDLKLSREVMGHLCNLTLEQYIHIEDDQCQFVDFADNDEFWIALEFHFYINRQKIALAERQLTLPLSGIHKKIGETIKNH